MEHKSPPQTLSWARDCPGCNTRESRVDTYQPSFQSSTRRCPRCHNEVWENLAHEAATLHHPVRDTDTTATGREPQQEENQERYEWGDNPLYHDEAEEALWSAERRQSENTAGSLGSPSHESSSHMTRSSPSRGQHSPSRIEPGDGFMRVRKKRGMWLVGPHVTPAGDTAHAITRFTVSDQVFANTPRHV
ncbi:hypothetical protein MAPG_05091 [Magnaporthiopsis poae ATCC 64411]|uniref:Uncharacterized protein n=1 Tax=Magnaporthiopsis poae (strain ATCC 64411 / 73-15) TaxID=644358 RepID=A0A0C4DYH0_MAGP6|nr:hypothetical protein MAPG_05091 [Magnaporthiopsis poae ATCC 64411]